MQSNGKKNCCLQTLLWISLFILIIHLPGSAQDAKTQDKIDPVFRRIIAGTNIRNCPPVPAGSSKKNSATKKAVASKKIVAAKKYDCIVYTVNANSLRIKGIIVNSVLPKFVTASATLCQILQMSALPEVKYIEAPHADGLH